MRTVIYELPNGKQITLEVDHMPWLGMTVQIPDGSGRYGRVISVGPCK